MIYKVGDKIHSSRLSPIMELPKEKQKRSMTASFCPESLDTKSRESKCPVPPSTVNLAYSDYGAQAIMWINASSP